MNHLLAIVEVCPRGEKGEMVPTWRASLKANLEMFGV